MLINRVEIALIKESKKVADNQKYVFNAIDVITNTNNQ